MNGATVFMRDVASVRDGYSVQQNVVRADGKPSVLLTIMKTGSVSTLAIVDEIKNRILPSARASAPKGMQIKELFDQSIFVRGAISGVLREGCHRRLPHGSDDSSVPGIVALHADHRGFHSPFHPKFFMYAERPGTHHERDDLGRSRAGNRNSGGRRHRDHREHSSPHGTKTIAGGGAGRRGANAAPTLVSTLTICIVFVSVVFLTGPAKYLFTPMALAVVFAMLASYLLSRTLVPVMSAYLLKGEQHEVDPATGVSGAAPHTTNWLYRVNERFNAATSGCDWLYRVAAKFSCNQKRAFLLTGRPRRLGLRADAIVGRDFFPKVDAGQLRLHVRAASGTRLESTKLIFSNVEQELRRVIPADEIELILDNIGRPSESFNFAFGDGSTIGTFDGEILIALKEGKHGPTEKYMAELRERLPRAFPSLLFFFQPADIVTQILNFGLPAPIDIQVAGYDPRNFDVARHIRERIARIPGVVDSHVHQVMDGPDLHYDIDRAKAAEFGLTAQDVSNSMFVSLSSSSQVQPNFYLDPKMGTTYLVAAQTPQIRLDTVEKIGNTPIRLSLANHNC